MNTYRLGLWFREPQGHPAGNPICHVYVKSPLDFGYDGAEDAVFLTPREFSPEVMSNQIDNLIAELHEIKAEAFRRYREYERRPKESAPTGEQ